MDKDYTKHVLTFFIIAIIVLITFGIKDYCHRGDINKLLLTKSVECNVQPTRLNNSENNSEYKLTNLKKDSKEGSTSSINKKDNNESENVVKKCSNNIEKKEETGIDLISNINENSSDEENINSEKDSYTNENINSDNIQLLARLIQSEAGDEPYQGKLAVGNVVLYRTREDSESISDTIYKKGQFDGVNTKNFNIKPSDDCIEAAKEVLKGKKVLSDGYYFVNLKVATPSWAKSSNFITRIGDHWFFKKE